MLLACAMSTGASLAKGGHCVNYEPLLREGDFLTTRLLLAALETINSTPTAQRGHTRKAVCVDALLRCIVGMPTASDARHAEKCGKAAVSQATALEKVRTSLLSGIAAGGDNTDELEQRLARLLNGPAGVAAYCSIAGSTPRSAGVKRPRLLHGSSPLVAPPPPSWTGDSPPCQPIVVPAAPVDVPALQAALLAATERAENAEAALALQQNSQATPPTSPTPSCPRQSFSTSGTTFPPHDAWAGEAAALVYCQAVDAALAEGDAMSHAWEATELVECMHQKVQAQPTNQPPPGECCLWAVVSTAQHARTAHTMLCTSSAARAAAHTRAVVAYTSARRAAAILCIQSNALYVRASTAAQAIDDELCELVHTNRGACTNTCCLGID